jgi:N-acetyl-gamma-glutamylphosphate reductase
MEMHKDTKYKVEVVEDYDIKVTDFNFIDPSYEYFGYDEEGPDHWEKWFYTISELRDEKLNELGI